ncbi:MAG: hypothetical protein EOP06_06610, partial [Proteobacteria bacterium]
TYDDAFRLTSVSYSDGQANISYSYDTNDRVVSVTANGVVKSFTYDSNGNRLTQTINVDGKTFTIGFGYDSEDRQTQVVYPNNSIAFGSKYSGANSITTTTDAFGRVKTMSDSQRALVSSATYHPNGLWSSMMYGNGVQSTMTLSPMKWPEIITVEGR